MRRLVRQKTICYALILTLVGSLTAPALAATGDSETRVLLCTSQGYQWVTIKTEKAADQSIDSTKSEHCVYCITSSDDNDLALVAHSTISLEKLEHHSSFHFFDDHAALSTYSDGLARAPPFLSKF